MHDHDIERRRFLRQSALGTAALLLAQSNCSAEEEPAAPAKRPNIIFILADDLGHADLGCYGQKEIKTPCLDRMAQDGMQFTQAYCGTSVCAPSRCSLMTGLHMGHAPIRANRAVKPEGQMPLPEGIYTLPRMLKDASYETACIGKWGLGFFGSSGDPNKVGFDHFFGYNCQSKAHDYYPDYLHRNAEKVPLDGKTYSHDLMTKEALEFVGKPRQKPFFLYLAYTIPHPTLAVPELGEYADKPWTEDEKTYAAMVSRMDRDVGKLLDLLKAKGLDNDTLVFFSSDHGAQNGKTDRFESNGKLSGSKRGMFEGSLRVPMLARWPGHVPAGKTCDNPWAFWDLLPTCSELAGGKIPAGVALDGISVVPGLLGRKIPDREYLYWELHEGPCKQAIRFGNWKALRNKPGAKFELFDLSTDPCEKKNLAASKPELVEKAVALIAKARVDSPDFPLEPTAK
jgi:arylsulfatase A